VSLSGGKEGEADFDDASWSNVFSEE